MRLLTPSRGDDEVGAELARRLDVVGDVGLEHQLDAERLAACCRMLSSRLRPMPQKPCPPDVIVRPLKWTSMSSQWLKRR